jgi:hypothetical protein
MRNFLKIAIISVFLVALQSCVYAKEDITEELREVEQDGEVVLNDENQDIETKTEVSEDVSDNTELDFEIFKIFDNEREVTVKLQEQI